jgi:hypothetical protein
MKKIFTIFLMVAAGITAAAQNWQDAFLFSEHVYGGTARTVGMGNAVTAIGGDPGTLMFNPAGSSVAAYSQFAITPALTFSSASATGTILEGDTQPIGFGDKNQTGYLRAKMPNISYISSFDTGRRRGLKRYAFGFSATSTNDFTSRFNASGVNMDNSFAASLASSADGFSTDVLGKEDWFYSGDPSRMPAWVDMVGFRSGMINSVAGRDGAYIALTETMDQQGNFRLAAPVFQKYGQQSNGYKSDILFNFSLDFSDKFYVGANLGFSNLRYNQVRYWQESPASEEEFPTIGYSDGTTARFSSLLMQHNYRANGSGLYLKAGFLWRPIPVLRLAAAVQTPTVMHITERYGYKGQVTLSGKSTLPASSPEDEWSYLLRTPWRFNAGIAFSLGTLAVLSADYEMADYGSCLFGVNTDGLDADLDFNESTFSKTNRETKQVLGVAHTLRAGMEMKVAPAVSLRAGYNLSTGAERDYASLLKHAFSLGAGYSSNGPFYLDAAVRLRTTNNEYFIPYYYYIADNAAQYYYKDVWDDVITPEIEVRSFLVDALLTLGWRF